MDIDGESVIEVIKDNIDRLFSAEKKVANYILENLDDVTLSNVNELSKKCGVSEATIVRMCKHLGYDGYYQFRLILSKDIGKITYSMKKQETNANNVLDCISERVLSLNSQVNMKKLIEITKIIIMSRRVHLLATGNTIPVILDLGFRMERFGIECSYSAVVEYSLNHLSTANNKDILIAVSRSGYSTQVINGIKLAKKKNMKIIAITGSKTSEINKESDVTINLKEIKGTYYDLGRPESHLLEMVINDIIIFLLDSYFNSGDERNKDDLDLILSSFKL